MQTWVGALVKWLWDETCNMKILGSNPSTHITMGACLHFN